MIYITGDMHGEQSRFYDPLLLPDGPLTENDTLIVCGDFGYVFMGDTTERLFLDDLENLPYTIVFADGNHENFPEIYQYPVVEWNGGKAHKIRRNIFHLMRGEIFDIEGKRFFAFGGAYSIDKYMRRESISWWKEELPTDLEYKNAIANLAACDNKVDYIITHTMPTEMIYRYGKRPDPHDAELTGFLGWVYHEVSFKHWYCGHWHNDLKLSEKLTVLWFDVTILK